MRYKACACFFLSIQLTACYLEGSNCTGSLCVSVAADFSNDVCVDGCDRQFRCPDADSISSVAASAINAARQSSVSTRCPVPSNVAPVTFNETLFASADRQARDMAGNNFVSVTGSGGVSIDVRVNALDASFNNVNQLVAGGFADTRFLINEWLSDNTDCQQLVSSAVTEFAMACRFDSNSDFGTYWSLVLAGK